jgi:hypothetical protein
MNIDQGNMSVIAAILVHDTKLYYMLQFMIYSTIAQPMSYIDMHFHLTWLYNIISCIMKTNTIQQLQGLSILQHIGCAELFNSPNGLTQSSSWQKLTYLWLYQRSAGLSPVDLLCAVDLYWNKLSQLSLQYTTRQSKNVIIGQIWWQ